VPLLGDIPLIGHLFRSTSNTSRKRNLMVFLRPTILRDGKAMNALSARKYDFIRKDEQRKKAMGLSLMSNDKMPLLPSWNSKLMLPPSFDDYKKKVKTPKKNKHEDDIKPPRQDQQQ